jgi:hypothetical protein
MSLHDPFDYLKQKLWPKERSRVKLPIWLPTIKNWESLRCIYVQVACDIPLKSFWQGLQLCGRPHFNRRSSHKIMGLQSCGSPNFKTFGTLGTKWHLGVGPVAKHKEYYVWEGGGVPQVQAMVNFVSLCLLVVWPCTKSALTTH